MSKLVSRQAIALECALHANKTNDVVAMIFMNAHTPLAKGEIESFGRVWHTEDFYDLRMLKNV
ncbi:hypothetical protein GCM10022626_10760 [[Pseudomonas] carboxydohydrogena]